MRVAVYDPFPRLIGPTVVGLQVLAGLKRMGYDAHRVTFTKSGKESLRWGSGRDEDYMCETYGVQWHPEPIETFKYGQGVLREFDWVFLTEPRVAPLSHRRELWMRELDGCRWTSRMPNPFEPYYVACKDEVLECLSHGDCRCITYFTDLHGEMLARNLPGTVRTLKYPVIPFQVSETPPKRAPTRTVVLAGRAVNNKGFPYLESIAEALPSGWAVAIRGSTSIGNGACATYRYAEDLVRAGWSVSITAPEDVPNPVLKPHPWVAQKVVRGKTCTIEYKGGYGCGRTDAEWWGMFVSLTAKYFAVGHVEVAGLEAMNAGVPCCLPKHQVQYAPYSVMEMRDDLSDAAEVVSEQARRIESGAVPSGYWLANRGTLQVVHDPVKYVRTVEAML